MDTSRNSTVLGALVIGLSLIIGTSIVGYTFYQVKALSNVISVTGSAEQTITSDTAKWTSSFSRNVGTDALKDGSSHMQSDLKTVLQYLHDHGVTDSEITVQPSTVQSVCANQNNVQYDKNGNALCSAENTSGYSFQQTIMVESSDVRKVQQLANDASGFLIDKGLVFTTNGVEYYYSKLADLKLHMLSDATKNAQQRASQIVESTGAHLSNLQSSEMGVFQITPVNSTEVEDQGAYDTTTIQKKVTAIVRASFTLK
jgi:hypothetical protein